MFIRRAIPAGRDVCLERFPWQNSTLLDWQRRRLIIIRGRKSGLPRVTPLAVIAVSGKRYVWAPWGEVHWVRNLRAAGKRGRNEDVRAIELDRTERVGFFRDTLGPLARRIPFGVWFSRIVDGVDLDRPLEAAEGRVVFELHPLDHDGQARLPIG